MFKFLANLFNLGKKKSVLDGVDVSVDKENRTMTIKTRGKLTDAQILAIFRKYVLGEE